MSSDPGCFQTVQEGDKHHFLCPLFCLLLGLLCWNFVGGATQPVCITDGILSCRRVQAGSLIKHAKFGADWSIYNKVIATSSVMAKHQISTVWGWEFSAGWDMSVLLTPVSSKLCKFWAHSLEFQLVNWKLLMSLCVKQINFLIFIKSIFRKVKTFNPHDLVKVWLKCVLSQGSTVFHSHLPLKIDMCEVEENLLAHCVTTKYNHKTIWNARRI